MSPFEQLDTLISPFLDDGLTQKSRCHPLQEYIPSSRGVSVWVKREDELNPTAIGSKLRKYLSLLPHLKSIGCSQVILIGGSNSNNVLGLSQILSALGVDVWVMVKTARDPTLRGHWLLLNLLLPKERIHLVTADEWPCVLNMASELAQKLEVQGTKPVIVPEGGDHPAVLPGILTIALDLTRNESESEFHFDHIWTDAGTGISAIGLVLGLHFLRQQDKTIHITLIAGTEAEFEVRYERFKKELERLTQAPLPNTRPTLCFRRPVSAAAFGSLNHTILKETKLIARTTGLLMDPVYSVKHFLTVKSALQQNPLRGNHLIMYNGGTQGLNGFQTRLAPLIE